ncbi:MAG: hypothetical protein ACRED2_01175 [Methylocella sp.]
MRGNVSPSGAASIPEFARMVSDAQERDIASNFLGSRGLDASARRQRYTMAVGYRLVPVSLFLWFVPYRWMLVSRP